MSQLQPIGKQIIAVVDDEFAHGYQVGYLQYILDYCRTSLHTDTMPLSDMDIYTLIVGAITNVHHAGRYQAGYVTGWIAALVEDQTPSRVSVCSFPLSTKGVNA